MGLVPTSSPAAAPTSALGNAYKNLAAAAGTYLTVSTAIKALRMADEFGKLEQRIKTATKETGDFNRVNRDLYQTAQDTGTAVGDTVSTFQRLALARKELQATNADILTVTKTVQQLGALSGASATAMQAGLLQFGQAMSSSIVRAEEFNSLVENMPAVVDRIALGMGKTTGQLRQAVIEGKVLSRDVFQALLEQAEGVNQEFSEIAPTLSRSLQQLENSTGRFLNELEKSTGIVENLAWFFGQIADSLDKSDGSFSGFLAAAGAFGPDAMIKMDYVAETRRLQAEHDDIEKRAQAKRKEIADLQQQVAAASNELLTLDPVNTTQRHDELGKQLQELRAEQEKLNKELKDTEALHDRVGKAAQKSTDAATGGAIDYEAALKNVNLQLKSAITLHQQQAREAKQAAEDTKALAKSFADVRSGLGSGAGTPDALSISSQSLKSEQLFSQGDYEGAVEAAEKARDMIEELGDAGGESELVLRGLLKRAEQAGLQAAQSIQAGKEASLQETNQVITDLLARAEQLKALKVGLDAAGAQAQANSLLTALQAQFSANPLVIPVTLSQSGGVQAPSEQPVQEYVTPLPIKRATGGPISGPGTGRSDSILMWGSNGEFMQPEASVKYYGQGFMELIRRRQLPRFVSNDGKSAPMFACARSLYSSIQRKQVRLKGKILDRGRC
mgnify:CR=1 FL=1